MSKVTAKFQMTIPAKVRKELGIVPGMDIDIAKEGKKYVLVVDPVGDLKSKWRGRFKGRGKTMDYIKEVRGEVT